MKTADQVGRGERRPRPSLAASAMIGAVRGYQRYLSPNKGAPTCRFTPSCSAYAVTALQKQGAIKGGWLALWRLCRCSPLSAGGYDPVPGQWPKR